MYLAVIILPLLSSIVSGLFGRKVGVNGSHVIACLSILLATLLAMVAFIEVGVNNIPVYLNLFRWIDSKSLNISWGFVFDTLTLSIIIPVLMISLLIHIYYIGYVSYYQNSQRFFSYLSLFSFMMIILVTSNNFLFMFVGLEGVIVCSYLLVSFWFTRITNQSSVFSFLANRIALGIGIIIATIIAIILFYNEYCIVGLLLIIFMISVFIIDLFIIFSLETILLASLFLVLPCELYISRYFLKICMSDLGNNYIWFLSLYGLNVIFMYAIRLYISNQAPTKFALVLTGIITFIIIFSNNWYIDFYSIFYITMEYQGPTMYKFIYGMDNYDWIDRRIANTSTSDLRTRKNSCGLWADHALGYLIKHFNFNTSFNYNSLTLAEKIKFSEKYQELLLYEIEREKIIKTILARGEKCKDRPRMTKSFMLELFKNSSK